MSDARGVVLGKSPFRGQVALVTGGASGIGLALSTELARRGAHVTIADLDGDLAEQEARWLRAGGDHDVVGTQVDVRDRAAVAALVEAVTRRGGCLDLLFNNAGVAVGGPSEELSGDHWDWCIDVNLGGTINGLLAAYPAMVERGRGHIVNTASAAGLVAPPLVAPYATSKHAVVGLTAALRPEAARHGVRVSVLCPGAVETPILDRGPGGELPSTASAPVTAREYLRVLGQHPMPAGEFAIAALDAVARNRGIIVVPRRAKAFWYLDRLSPTLTARVNQMIAARITARLVKPASG